MQKRVVVKVLSVFVPVMTGLAIVGISLVAATRVQSKDTSSITSRRLYMGKEILPDHVLYPALMVADRVKIQFAAKDERIHLQVLYAQRRLDSAQALMEKGEQELAVSTFTKAQKYLLQAAQGASEDGVDQTTIDLVRSAIAQYLTDADVCQEKHGDQIEVRELDALTQELRMAGEHLASQ